MKDRKKELEKRREELVSRMSELSPWIQGSVVVVQRVCGQKGCACHRGGKKHPAMDLTGKEEGKTVALYVPRKLEAEARVWSDNYKRLKALIREVSLVQRQILKLRSKTWKKNSPEKAKSKPSSPPPRPCSPKPWA
mgnify:CR=1 FL=1